MESAVAEIHSKKELLKHLKMTIIPVLSVSWDGEGALCDNNRCDFMSILLCHISVSNRGNREGH